MPTASITIDLGELPFSSYIGRKNGQMAREKFKLDTYNPSTHKIILVTPESTRSINSSFFLGLFGKDIKKIGSPQGFYDYVDLSRTPPRFHEKIKQSTERALISNDE